VDQTIQANREEHEKIGYIARRAVAGHTSFEKSTAAVYPPKLELVFSRHAVDARASSRYGARMVISRSLLIKIIAAATAFFAVALLLAWQLVPGIVKDKLQQAAGQALGRPVTVQTVRFNPLTLELALEGLQIAANDGQTPLLTVGSARANASMASLFNLAPVISALTIDAPSINIVRLSAGRFNFSDIADKIAAMPQQPDSAPLRFSVSNIRLTNGTILVDDRLTTGKHDARAIRLDIPFISNLPSKVEVAVQPYFAAVLDGSPVELKGETKPFKDTLESTLRLNLQDVDLLKYVDFIPMQFNFSLASAQLNAQLSVSFRRPAGSAPEIVLGGNAQLNRVRINSKVGAPLLAFDRLALEQLDFKPLAQDWHLSAVVLSGLNVNMTRQKNGELDVVQAFAVSGKPSGKPAGVAAPAEPAAPAAKPSATRVRIDRLGVGNSTFRFTDKTPARDVNIEFSGLQLGIAKLDTAPQAAPLAWFAQGQLNGAQTSAQGQFDIAAAKGDALIEFKDSPLLPFAPYWQTAFIGEVGKPLLTARLPLQFEGADMRMQAGQAQLTGLALAAPRQPRALAAVEAVTVGDVALSTAARTLTLGNARLEGVSANVERNAQGRLNILDLLPPSGAGRAAQAAPQASTDTAAPWKFEVGTFTLQGKRLVFTDRTVPDPVALQLDRLQAGVSNFSTAGDAKPTIRLRTGINRSGALVVDGNFSLQPLAVNARIDARSIDLMPAQPYVMEQLNLALASGFFSGAGNLAWAQTGRTVFKGKAQINDLKTVDKVNAADFIRFKTLALDGVDVNIAADQQMVNLQSIALDELYLRLIINSDGRLNLQDIRARKDAAPTSITQATASAPAASAPVQEAPAPPSTPDALAAAANTPAPQTAAAGGAAPVVRLGAITLTRSNVNFTDNFIRPNYTANLTQLTGRVGAMASDNIQPGELELRGRVDDDAPIEIAGQLNPLGPSLYTNITADARGIELTRLTPYAAKYAGYAIEKGKLSVKVKYLIENGKLQAENNLFLDQLTFGQRVESPDALKIPVLLAVALLKNSRGEIDINLPIAGSLSDPQFSIGGIIIRVLVNLIVKAVTSPFTLLASAFGGGQELSFIEFAPGSAAITDTSRKRIETLAKALTDRPGLKLDIAGRADPAFDTDGIKKAALAEKVRAAKTKDLIRQAISNSDVQVSAEEYPKYLTQAYTAETFAKPRNVVGIAKTLPVEEMEKLMLANVRAGDEELRTLANKRGSVVKEALESLKVPQERLFLQASRLTPEGIKDKGATARVDFALK
jgi:hypothetical protein